MATTTTFTTLKQDIQNYLERGSSAVTDPSMFDQIPRLINLTERSIARELKVQGFISPVTTQLSAGVSVYDKPDRWTATVSINIGTGAGNTKRAPVLPRSYEYLRTFWPDEAVTGTPQFYADYDFNHWVLAPTPAADAPMEVLFYQLPPLLDETVQTNWLTDFAPQALLFGALLEATPFLKNDARIPVWQAKYDRAMLALSGEDIGKILDRASARKGA